MVYNSSMKLIERKGYLEKLIHTMHTPDIKVITGIRRSGKSKLLESFMEYVKSHVGKANVIHINFNLMQYDSLRNAASLNEYAEGNFVAGAENFLLIDEVQMCDGFERAVNSLHASERFHIYITGSNAFLLSSDLATLFTGRTFEIKVFPFSFCEYLEYYGENDIQAAFDDYAKYGGMAGSYLYQAESEKYGYISDVFRTLVVRDIQQKYKIRNMGLLNRLTDFLLDNISLEVSTHSIANTLTSSKENTNNKTISAYLRYLCSSFAFYKVRRYDIRGKKYLSSQDKYYLADHSFKYAILGTRNLDYGHVYENIVAIELLRRGYELYTGVLYNKEIDFVAIRQSEKIYIQVSDDISAEKTFEREIAPLLSIRDAYPKMIIARTRHEEYSVEGVKVMDMAAWLSEA